MDSAILISALALGLSAVTFFYKLGRDTNKKEDKDIDNEMLSQIYRSTETINKKLDDIAEWQRKRRKSTQHTRNASRRFFQI